MSATLTSQMIAYKILFMLYNGRGNGNEMVLGKGMPKFVAGVDFEIPGNSLLWGMDQFAQGVLLEPVYELLKKIGSHGCHQPMSRKITLYEAPLFKPSIEGLNQQRASDDDIGTVLLIIRPDFMNPNQYTGRILIGRILIGYDVEEISPQRKEVQ